MVKMKFQWFFDIATIPDTMQILSVSAGGEMVRRRLAPFFGAYKYFKLGNVSLKLVPASTLPVDPTGLSYEAGENTVDPRDQLNPGLTRITNGEDILDDLVGPNTSQQRAMYYNMMLDPRWFKWSLQSGLQRSARPLYWQIGQLHQDFYPGATVNVPMRLSNVNADTLGSTASVHFMGGRVDSSTDAFQQLFGITDQFDSDPRGIFQTGHKGKLGWLPTDALVKWATYDGETATIVDSAATASIPEIDVFKIILPPAYKTKYYYRAYVTETVYFKSPVYINCEFYNGEDVGEIYNPVDRFVYNIPPRADLPWFQPTSYPAYPSEGNNGQGEVVVRNE